MPPNDQGILTNQDAQAILRTLSTDRFSTYLVASGHDQQRAFKMYIWNAQVGEAFHTAIQAVEVALRNSINYGIIRKYNTDWWRNSDLSTILDEERTGDLSEVLRRISNRGLTLCNGQVVAGLSFGFWVGMLQRRYNPPIWSQHFRHAFPHLPGGIARDDILEKARTVAKLRNRISHHEPLVKRDISADYKNVMDLLTWLCPTKVRWIREHSRVPDVLRRKP